ncbi:putative deoxyuridine 5'-triphosphate nucleotidohydrolase [Aureococcus anophagefferens virus]|uniref:dUTP diphosphatase n=1 Tax=Aureococcus anophagefferens virus TaxID=1474867 RepID=A0A076FFC9_9VIRU|nr:putative deoxyuridine 5'-triphosphate nucleotidohydrolase [Aureococcus anophagefferens virus]AII16944.1 putative deoxyuridine 5'-triphosphate nucleotidohydrolase [Aureococcus anophagefferens virus]
MFLKIKAITDFTYNYFKFVANESATESGLDLVTPQTTIVPPKAIGFKIKLGLKCEPSFEDGLVRGFYLYPRSSMGSKTPLRLANSVGIIDFSYRGEIMAVVDNISDEEFKVEQGVRLFQLCSPDLSPIKFKLLTDDEELSSTDRGEGGFGSTGIEVEYKLPKQIQKLFD